MSVYLFTLHSYGSWMPDRMRGYVRRGEGVLPADLEMAGRYRDAMRGRGAVTFDGIIQRVVIDSILAKARIKGWTCHGIATDPTHVHVLLAWDTDERWLDVRRGLKASITRRLNEQVHPQQWLTDGGSRKRVRDRGHFDYLLSTYLPSHRGRQWYRQRHRPM